MKRLISALILAALCAGCSHSTDSAKIDALAQKLDVVLKNQAAINARLDTLSTNVADFDFYYYTNTIDTMHLYHTNGVDVITSYIGTLYNAQITSQTALNKAMAGATPATPGFNDDDRRLLNNINESVDGISADWQKMQSARMQSDLEQIQEDVDEIKSRLGIR